MQSSGDVAASDPFQELDEDFFRGGEPAHSSGEPSERPVTLDDEWRPADPHRDAEIAARRARFARWVTPFIATLGLASVVAFLHGSIRPALPVEAQRVTAPSFAQAPDLWARIEPVRPGAETPLPMGSERLSLPSEALMSISSEVPLMSMSMSSEAPLPRSSDARSLTAPPVTVLQTRALTRRHHAPASRPPVQAARSPRDSKARLLSVLRGYRAVRVPESPSTQ